MRNSNRMDSRAKFPKGFTFYLRAMNWNGSYSPEPYMDLDQDQDSSETTSCSQGHRSSLCIATEQGGSICLLCFSNLISNHLSPTVYVSYALTQLSVVISQPHIHQTILNFHSHFLVSSLVNALISFDDEPIARQVIDLITGLCGSGEASVCCEFVTRVSDRLSTGDLAWSRRQAYMIHCLGILLNTEMHDPCAHIKDKYSLISNLVKGLQLPSQEIQGEILFVLYKISILQHSSEEGDENDIFALFCPKLLYLLAEALLKSQNNDVRLNCVALLAVLAQRGLLRDCYETGGIVSWERDDCSQASDEREKPSLITLFASAIKGPLLSSDSQLQISTLDLLFHYLSSKAVSGKQILTLLEENIADYVFEILRLSEYKDPVVSSCIRVLDLLSAEKAYDKRLVIGFSSLLPALRYVAEIPFHSAQSQTLKLILACISESIGAVSTSQLEELVHILKMMLRKHNDAEMTMLPDTFIMICLVFVALIKSPSIHGTLDLATSISEASKQALLTCLFVSEKNSNQILHCLYLVKEAYAYSLEGRSNNSSKIELRNCILNIFKTELLPWLVACINEMGEEIVLGLLETFHSVLLQDSNKQALEFSEALISSGWFSFSFGCLGLFTSVKMKHHIYMLLSSLLDVLLSNDSGQPIRDATPYLPSDPVDLLFLLGQRSNHSPELSFCQSSVLLILYTSSLYDERLADEKSILASVEQYIILNSRDFQGRGINLLTTRLVNLYGLLRGLAKIRYQIPYSAEAERILFNLINEDGWDLLSAKIHPVSLKWLFQQEKISKPLSHQILKFSRSYSSAPADVIVHGVHGNIDQTSIVQALAKIVSAGDNYGARLFICLLIQLIEDDGQELDISSVISLMEAIIEMIPNSSDQFCLHGIGTAIKIIYDSSNFTKEIHMSILVLVHNILCFVHPETLSDEGSWLAVIIKIMDYTFLPETNKKLTPEGLFVIVAVLSLVLHHSTNKVLEETSKTILFNSYMVSTVNSVIGTTFSKSTSQIELDEGTSNEELLISILLLNYFSTKSLNVALPWLVDWGSFLDTTHGTNLASFISIPCHDLCRLLYFGSPVIKLIASYTLVELFTGISDQRNRTPKELKCDMGYLVSLKCVLEGLIFYTDPSVANNCGLCLKMLLEWVNPGTEQTEGYEIDSWCRLIIEELAMSLAAPTLVSQSLINGHKPAIYVAIGLLKLPQVPAWMRSVFNASNISGIVKNLSPNDLDVAILSLFRELVNCEFLNNEHFSTLNRVIQARRNFPFPKTTNPRDSKVEQIKKVVTSPFDLGEAFEYLITLMSSESYIDNGSSGSYLADKRLLEEIESFFRALTTEDDGTVRLNYENEGPSTI